MPKSIRLALIIIWGDFALGVLVALLDRLIGSASAGAFSFGLIMTAILTIIPYKIATRSNAARYFWMVINIFGYLAFIGLPKAGDEGEFSAIATWITLPFILYSIYLLFVKESNIWFRKKEGFNEV